MQNAQLNLHRWKRRRRRRQQATGSSPRPVSVQWPSTSFHRCTHHHQCVNMIANTTHTQTDALSQVAEQFRCIWPTGMHISISCHDVKELQFCCGEMSFNQSINHVYFRHNGPYDRKTDRIEKFKNRKDIRTHNIKNRASEHKSTIINLAYTNEI